MRYVPSLPHSHLKRLKYRKEVICPRQQLVSEKPTGLESWSGVYGLRATVLN